MKALRNHKDGLQIDDIPVSSPGQNELLIEVHATALTAGELGWPETVARENPIPGHDVAGTVSAVGAGVTGFKEGDEVFALTSFDREGSAAEYSIAASSELAIKPPSLSFEEAASIPLSALTAWQAIHLHSTIKRGQKVLVTGAGGGVGVLVVQIARLADLKISALCSAEKKDLVQSLGATEVFDYRKVDIKTLSHDYDLVIDCAGGHTLSDCFDLAKGGGKVISLARPVTDDEKARRPDVESEFFIVEPDGEELARIAKLCDEGSIKTVLHTTFPLEKGKEAFELLNEGHAKGKIVLKMG